MDPLRHIKIDSALIANVLAISAMMFIALIVLGFGRPAQAARTRLAETTVLNYHPGRTLPESPKELLSNR
jgi:hypothetical protein